MEVSRYEPLREGLHLSLVLLAESGLASGLSKVSLFFIACANCSSLVTAKEAELCLPTERCNELELSSFSSSGIEL